MVIQISECTMQKAFFLSTLVMITFAQAELFKEYFKDGVVKSEIEYKKGTRTEIKEGIKEGLEKVYYNSGQIAYTVHNVDGKREGALDWYDREKNHLERIHYKAGKRDGLNQIFYTSGKLRSEVTYVNDLKEGEEREYYSTGQLASKVNYVHGKKEGEQIEYYEDGKIRSKVTYRNNYKEGEKKYFDKQGKVTKTELYKMDRPINVMKEIQKKRPDATIDAFKVLDFNPQNRRPD